MPEYIDTDGDRVQIIASMDTEAQTWIHFDQDYRSFTLTPTNSTQLDMTNVNVFLNDGTDMSEYILQIWVLEAEQKQDI